MTDYKEVPVQIVGGDVRSRSRQWNGQTCVNMYPDTLGTGRSESALLPWPGHTLIRDVNNFGIDELRGIFVFRDRLYAVLSDGIYRVSETAGTAFKVFSFPAGGKVSTAVGPDLVVIRTEGSVDYINGRYILGGAGKTYLFSFVLFTEMIVPDGLNDRSIAASNLTTYPGNQANFGLLPAVFPEDVIQADATNDDVLQVFVFQQKIYIGGKNSIQIVYLTGQSPPLAPYDQAVSNTVGVAGPLTMAATNNAMYFVGSDNAVYRMASSQVEKISNSAIASQIRGRDSSNFNCYVMVIDNQHFYVINDGPGEYTIAYSEETGAWIRLGITKFTGEIGGYRALFYTFFQGKHVGATHDGNFFHLDFEDYEDLGLRITRQVTTMPINGRGIGIFGKMLVFGYMDIDLEITPGQSATFGEMQIEYSSDSGLTFKTATIIDMTPTDSTFYRARWNDCFCFYDMVVRFTVTDPVFFSLHGASVALQPGGY